MPRPVIAKDIKHGAAIGRSRNCSHVSTRNSDASQRASQSMKLESRKEVEKFSRFPVVKITAA